MGFLDLLVIAVYLGGVLLLGVVFTRRQNTSKHYFTGDRSIPAWAVAASIVATETSTVTFIAVPGIAFARGGNFQFLQLAMGYVLGRVVVTLLFIPAYFRGELLTVYQLLNRRFGTPTRMVAASLFVVMRNVADGVRLLLTAVVLAAAYVAFFPGHSEVAATGWAVVALGVVMIVFTYFGGIEAVIWVEVMQLGVYLAGAIAAAVVLAQSIPGGVQAAIETAHAHEKFQVFDFTFTLAKTYTFWAGVIGGCFLTMSTHGTDQYMVQRYLCTDRPAKAGAALLASGVFVLLQFALFLFIGVLLFAFYKPYADPDNLLGPPAAPFAGGDKVFPHFITNHLSHAMPGLAGLVIAAILAAALSSSLSAIASTVVTDLYKPIRPAADDNAALRLGKRLVLVFGLVQIAVALAMMRSKQSALDSALTVAGLANGPVLGMFLVGSIGRRTTQSAALAGFVCGAAAVLSVFLFLRTQVAWPWYTLIGALVVLAVSLTIAVMLPAPKTDGATL
jgi:SSS family transporter